MTAQLPSKKEANNLATRVLPASFLVVHDAIWCGEDNMAELTRRQEVACNLFNTTKLNIEPRGDDPAFVDASNQLNDNLARPMVVHDFQITNVTMLLHNLQKLDNHL